MPVQMGIKRLWCSYNHMPGGQVVVQHFENLELERRTGDDTSEKVKFTAEERLKSFEKSDFVALYLKGQLHKNKVLVYDGPDLGDHPRAADMVIEWALKQGQQPIVSKAAPTPVQQDLADRVVKVETRIDSIESKIDQLLARKSA